MRLVVVLHKKIKAFRGGFLACITYDHLIMQAIWMVC